MTKIPAVLLSACCSLPLFASAAPPAPPTKPNIIFILCDDLGWGDVGVFYQNGRRAAGLPAELTPQLDAMAGAGARFTNQYSACPVCAPSRASILSGVDQGHSNVRDNQFDKAIADNHTLGTVLRQAGYATAAIGKWGLQGTATDGKAPHWPAAPWQRGFDYFYGYMRHRDGHQHYPKEGKWSDQTPQSGLEQEDGTQAAGPGKEVWEGTTEVSAGLDRCYTADLWTARAKQWIVDQHARTPRQPFFLYLAFDTPHAVIELPTQAYPGGGGLHGGLQWVGEPHHMINTASGMIDSYIYPEYRGATFHGAHWPQLYQRYASCVRRIDDCVGDVLQLLKDLHLADNTLVVFTSDNGPSIESYLPQKITPQFFGGYGPFDGIKRDCWEGGMREPSIVWWPGQIRPGQVIDQPSGLWDWLPTFADAAGLPAPARTDGVSLLPELTGRGVQRDPGFLYFEYMQKGRTPNFPEFEPNHRDRVREQMQAIRMGELLGVRYDIKSERDDFEIYNVAHDPKEAKDLGRDPAYENWQRRFKAQVIQARRPDPGAPRPYDSALMEPVTDGGHGPAGLVWQSYPGSFPWVPDFASLAAAKRGVVPQPAAAAAEVKADGGCLLSGLVEVPADGEYTFYLRADTGAFLRIHDAAVIDADFGYAGGSMRSGAVRLKAGLHPLRLSYVHRGTAAAALELDWQGPGIPRQPVPASAFVQPVAP